MSRFNFKATFTFLAMTAMLLAVLGCSGESDLTATPDVTLDTGSQTVPPPPGAIKLLPTKKDGTKISLDGGWHFEQDNGFWDEEFVDLEEAVVEEISANGGKLSNGVVTLDFPRGALNLDAHISIEMSPTGLMVFELGPHGLRFNKPVVIELDLKDTSHEGKAHEVDIMWWDPRNKQWHTIEQLRDKDEDTPRAVLWHFSKYSGVGG